MGSNIVGSLLSAYVLDLLTDVDYSLIMLASACCAIFSFIFIRKPLAMTRPISLRIVEEAIIRKTVRPVIKRVQTMAAN